MHVPIERTLVVKFSFLPTPCVTYCATGKKILWWWFLFSEVVKLSGKFNKSIIVYACIAWSIFLLEWKWENWMAARWTYMLIHARKLKVPLKTWQNKCKWKKWVQKWYKWIRAIILEAQSSNVCNVCALCQNRTNKNHHHFSHIDCIGERVREWEKWTSKVFENVCQTIGIGIRVSGLFSKWDCLYESKQK